MMNSALYNKVSVWNPINLCNTVGAELADIFEAHGILDYNALLGISDLRRKEKLSNRIIEKVVNLLGKPHLKEYLGKFQNDYLENKNRYAAIYKKELASYKRLKCVLPLLRGEFLDEDDALGDILDFFGVYDADEVFDSAQKRVALFRTQNKIKIDPVNLLGWLRRGELDFSTLQLPTYSEEGLSQWIKTKEWFEQVEDTTYFLSLPTVLAQFGVGLVFVPSLPNTVYGAIRWIDGKPLVQISDRGRDLASCWFTLMHELGHALLHREQDIYELTINSHGDSLSKIEREANKFANSLLFNGDNLRKAVFDRKKKGQRMSATALAEEFGVKSIFASYWLTKAGYEPTFQRRISIDFVSAYQ